MFSGDLNQLGPVLKDFIPTTMMLFAKRHKKHPVLGRRRKILMPSNQFTRTGS
jgi:hypothetical protein